LRCFGWKMRRVEGRWRRVEGRWVDWKIGKV